MKYLSILVMWLVSGLGFVAPALAGVDQALDRHILPAFDSFAQSADALAANLAAWRTAAQVFGPGRLSGGCAKVRYLRTCPFA